MTHPMSAIANEYLSEEDVAELKRRKEITAKENNALRNLMEHKDFSVLMKILLDITNYNGNNYTEDTHMTYHLGGRSYVMYELLASLGAIDPTYYPRLLLKLMEADNDNPEQ